MSKTYALKLSIHKHNQPNKTLFRKALFIASHYTLYPFVENILLLVQDELFSTNSTQTHPRKTGQRKILWTMIESCYNIRTYERTKKWNLLAFVSTSIQLYALMWCFVGICNVIIWLGLGIINDIPEHKLEIVQKRYFYDVVVVCVLQ